MFERELAYIDQIFVGRRDEIARLQGLWESILIDREHKIYVLLNASGIGKTSLIQHFSYLLDKNNEGLSIIFKCSNRLTTPESILISMLRAIFISLEKNDQIIHNYLINIHDISSIDREKNKIVQLKVKIESLLNKKPTISDIIMILSDISDIIPIFLAADDIQELILLEYESSQKFKTAIHFLSSLLKDLLDSRILLLLSGNNQEILSQIGIIRKVELLEISKFKIEEIHEYIGEVEKNINQIEKEIDPVNYKKLFDYYKKSLFEFSEGFPKMIAEITKTFCQKILNLYQI